MEEAKGEGSTVYNIVNVIFVIIIILNLFIYLFEHVVVLYPRDGS